MEHGDWTHTGQLYEELVRGIWIMHSPRLFRNPVAVDIPVSHLDVLPTLFELLQVQEESSSFDGVSQMSLLTQEPTDGEDRFVFGLLQQRAYVFDGEYKLIFNNNSGKKELYNLKNDPEEQYNLSREFPEIVERLRVKLTHAFQKKGIQLWSTSYQSGQISNQTLERLKSLGYVK